MQMCGDVNETKFKIGYFISFLSIFQIRDFKYEILFVLRKEQFEGKVVLH